MYSHRRCQLIHFSVKFTVMLYLCGDFLLIYLDRLHFRSLCSAWVLLIIVTWLYTVKTRVQGTELSQVFYWDMRAEEVSNWDMFYNHISCSIYRNNMWPLSWALSLKICPYLKYTRVLLIHFTEVPFFLSVLLTLAMVCHALYWEGWCDSNTQDSCLVGTQIESQPRDRYQDQHFIYFSSVNSGKFRDITLDHNHSSFQMFQIHCWFYHLMVYVLGTETMK
jgi:hypothetical protein